MPCIIKKWLLHGLLLPSSFLYAAGESDTIKNALAADKAKANQHSFTFSGYQQIQYEYLPQSQPAHRFKIRRGRLKTEFSFNNRKAQPVFYATAQINITESQINPVEYYIRLHEPLIQWLSISAGMMNRPFGYEVVYSSRRRESPERGRMSPILFPAERDLGVMLTIQAPPHSPWSFFKINAGVFNGTGLGFAEMDPAKDFIGQIVFNKTWLKKQIQLSGGASYYYGKVLQSVPVYYLLKKDYATQQARYQKHSNASAIGKHYFAREYAGLDVQLTGTYPRGSTTLRAEFIVGRQPGTATGSKTPTAPGHEIYNRQFHGGYFYLIQTFQHVKRNMQHQLVLKYDFYDPNTQLSGKQIATTSDPYVSTVDIHSHTFGCGYIFEPARFFKLMLYYDLVSSEITPLTSAQQKNQHIVTLRTQFTFHSSWLKK